MQTQFGNDSKRDGIELRAQIICILCCSAMLIFELVSIFNGSKTWSEAIKSDWPIALLLIGSFPGRLFFYVPLVLLPILVWFQSGADPLNPEIWRHASWQLWLPTVLWLFYVLIFFSMLFKGTLFVKNNKVA